MWGLNTVQPHFTLEGHDKGVNCIDYFTGGDRPYLVSGADDNTVKVWDYQTKQCVQTMEGHTHNVATVCCHPELPIIMSGSEDGCLKIWHATTYRLENTLNYAFERCWSIAALKGTNNVAIGYDEGTVAIQLGNEDPLASMDASGKIILAKHNEISLVDLNKMEGSPSDGERLSIPSKELDVCEIYPQSLQHNSNGRFAVVTGDGEYIIYTALAWRKKTFGNALDFVWALDSGEYAVRESPMMIKLFRNFKETRTFKPPFAADALLGGALMCASARPAALAPAGSQPPSLAPAAPLPPRPHASPPVRRPVVSSPRFPVASFPSPRRPSSHRASLPLATGSQVHPRRRGVLFL